MDLHSGSSGIVAEMIRSPLWILSVRIFSEFVDPNIIKGVATLSCECMNLFFCVYEFFVCMSLCVVMVVIDR